MSAFDKAWQFLKTDFSDIAPFPSRYKLVPEGVPYDSFRGPNFTTPRQYTPSRIEIEQGINRRIYEQDPQTNQRYMEQDYMPDLQEMLELEAIRQASGQQVPRNLLREPEYSSYRDDADGPRRMMNVPLDRQNLPLQE